MALLVYIEDFRAPKSALESSASRPFAPLIDRTVGEAARLRRADAITLVPKALPGEGLTLSNSGNSSSRKAPECRRMTLKDYAWLPHEYGMRPDTRPGAPFLADVTEGITHCPPLRLPLRPGQEHRHGRSRRRGHLRGLPLP